MSMTSVEAADFSKKDKKQPTYLIQYKFPNSLIKHTGSFLGARDLSIFGRTAKFSLEALKDDVAIRKLVAHVFAAKPEILGDWFSKQNAQAKKILTQTHCHEGYQSTKIVTFRDGRQQIQQREKPLFICFRNWRNVSALQATAFSGDIPFLLKLLSQILVKDKEIVEEYRIAALQQLEAVSRRISDQTIILDAVTAIAEMESDDTDAVTKNAAKLRLEKMQQSEEFQRLITDSTQVEEASPSDMKPKDSRPLGHFQAPAPASTFPSELKTKAESKEASENTKIKYADEAEFLESLLSLLKAYINSYIQYPKLSAERRWAEIDKLGEIEGECIKWLSEAFKQVMCDDKPFSLSPLPKFDSEPKRGPCRDWNGNLLDLDSFGLRTGYGLYKGRGLPAVVGPHSAWRLRDPCVDMASFAHLYKLQRDRLGNIIEQLKTPETAQALIFPDKRPSAKYS